MRVEMPQKIRPKAHLKSRAIHDLQALERLIAHLAELLAHPGRQAPGFSIVEQRSYDDSRRHDVGARGFHGLRATLVNQSRVLYRAYPEHRRSGNGARRVAMCGDILSAPSGLLDRCYNFTLRE